MKDDTGQGIVMLTKEDLDNIQIGDKYNFGGGEIVEVIGFLKEPSLWRRWTGTGFENETLDMVTVKDANGNERKLARGAFLRATKDLSDGLVACSYCRALLAPADIEWDYIISPNWKANNYRSPKRPYCKGKDCSSYDQMAHEG